MSIIYNALQKAQRNRQNKSEAPTRRNRGVWWDAALVGIIILLVMVAIYGYYPKSAKTTSSAKAVVTQPAAPVLTIDVADYKSKHILNGIYLSEQEKIAFINSKFFHLGETVDGMKIVSIETNRVVLRHADTALILETNQA